MLSRGNARNQAHACSTMHAYKVGTVMSSLSRLVEIVDFQSIELFKHLYRWVGKGDSRVRN